MLFILISSQCAEQKQNILWIPNIGLDSLQAATSFRQISFPAICHSRQQLYSYLPRSGECRERVSHVTMSPCLLPSGDTVKCRLRVTSVAKQPYSNFILIVPHGLAIMFIRMFRVHVEEQPWPNLPVLWSPWASPFLQCCKFRGQNKAEQD